MKKLLMLLLCVLLLTGCGRGQEDALPTAEEEPQSKTVYVHSSITRTQNGSTGKTEYIYNEENLLTDVIISDEAGQELQRYLVTCDENGNPVNWDTSVGDTVSSLIYTYDDRGHTLGTYAYTGETLTTSTEYTWSGDLRIRVTVRVPAQNYEQRTEYTYDDKNVLQRQDLYVGGNLSGYTLYTSDTQGRPTLGENYSPDGAVTGTIAYTYHTNTEKRITTAADGSITQVQDLTYDLQGNLLSSHIYDGSGNLQFAEVHIWHPIEVPAEVPRAGV